MSDHERAESPEVPLVVADEGTVPSVDATAPDEIPRVSRASSRSSRPASAVPRPSSATSGHQPPFTQRPPSAHSVASASSRPTSAVPSASEAAPSGVGTEPEKKKTRRRAKKKHGKRPSQAKRARAKKRKRAPTPSTSESSDSESSTSSSSESEDDTAADLRKLRKQVANLAATQTSLESSFIQTVEGLNTSYTALRNEVGAINARLDAYDLSTDRVDTAIRGSEARQSAVMASAIDAAIRASEDRQESARTALSTRLTGELRSAVARRTPPSLPAPSPMDMRLSTSPSVHSASSDGRRST